MDVSFSGVSSADASLLAQELELSLIRAGAPRQAISLRQSSSENMSGLGTILGVDVDLALHAIGAMGYLACFAHCIFEIASKHRVEIVINTEDGTIKIPAAQVTTKMIAQAIAPKNIETNTEQKS